VPPCSHLLADASGAMPRVVDEVDGPLGSGHVTQHQPLAVIGDAVTTANSKSPQAAAVVGEDA
jgi:hypothetical protein